MADKEEKEEKGKKKRNPLAIGDCSPMNDILI